MFVQTVPSINDLLFLFLDSICFPHPSTVALTNEFAIFFCLRYYERSNFCDRLNLVKLWGREGEEEREKADDGKGSIQRTFFLVLVGV